MHTNTCSKLLILRLYIICIFMYVIATLLIKLIKLMKVIIKHVCITEIACTLPKTCYKYLTTKIYVHMP